MLEESVPSIWASMNSWFTPTVLFVLLNVVIGTIAVTSKGIRGGHPKNEDDLLHHHQDDHRRLTRGPSSVLERLKSIGLYHYRSDEIPIETTATSDEVAVSHHDDHRRLTRGPSSVLERLKSIGLYRYRSGEIPVETAAAATPDEAVVSHHKSQAVETFETLDEAYEAASASSSHEHHFLRSQSDSPPTAGEMPAKLPGKLKKSATTKSAFAHFEEAEVVARRPATVRESTAAQRRRAAEDEEVDAKADDFINRFRQQLKLQRLDSFMRYKEMLSRGK